MLFVIPKYIRDYSYKANLLTFTSKKFFEPTYGKYKYIAYFYNNLFSLWGKKRKKALELLEEYEDYMNAIILSQEDVERKYEIIEKLKDMYAKPNWEKEDRIE